MAAAVEMIAPNPDIELIWASPRELLNVFQANAVGCHIITATSDILKKLDLVGKDLDEYSSRHRQNVLCRRGQVWFCPLANDDPCCARSYRRQFLRLRALVRNVGEATSAAYA